MKTTAFALLIASTFLLGCGGAATLQNGAAPAATPASNVPSIPKDGDYTTRGKVTKINTTNGSIEIDHDAIPDMMPAMIMEFNVKDKAMLNGLKVGDTVKFIIEYKNPAETIIHIEKVEK